MPYEEGLALADLARFDPGAGHAEEAARVFARLGCTHHLRTLARETPGLLPLPA
jgi:hypothetical protein